MFSSAVEPENDGVVVSEVVAAIIIFVLFKVSGEEEEFPTDSSCSTSEDVIPSKVWSDIVALVCRYDDTGIL